MAESIKAHVNFSQMSTSAFNSILAGGDEKNPLMSLNDNGDLVYNYANERYKDTPSAIIKNPFTGQDDTVNNLKSTYERLTTGREDAKNLYSFLGSQINNGYDKSGLIQRTAYGLTNTLPVKAWIGFFDTVTSVGLGAYTSTVRNVQESAWKLYISDMRDKHANETDEALNAIESFTNIYGQDALMYINIDNITGPNGKQLSNIAKQQIERYRDLLIERNRDYQWYRIKQWANENMENRGLDVPLTNITLKNAPKRYQDKNSMVHILSEMGGEIAGSAFLAYVTGLGARAAAGTLAKGASKLFKFAKAPSNVIKTAKIPSYRIQNARPVTQAAGRIGTTAITPYAERVSVQTGAKQIGTTALGFPETSLARTGATISGVEEAEVIEAEVLDQSRRFIGQRAGAWLGTKMAPALVASAGQLGYATVFGTSFMRQYYDVRMETLLQGGDIDTANKTALIAGLAEGGLEFAGFKLFNRFAKSKGGFVKLILNEAIPEGLQEASQQLAEDIIKKKYGVSQQDFIDIAIDTLVAGAAGAVGGAFLGSMNINWLKEEDAEAIRESKRAREENIAKAREQHARIMEAFALPYDYTQSGPFAIGGSSSQSGAYRLGKEPGKGQVRPISPKQLMTDRRRLGNEGDIIEGEVVPGPIAELEYGNKLGYEYKAPQWKIGGKEYPRLTTGGGPLAFVTDTGRAIFNINSLRAGEKIVYFGEVQYGDKKQATKKEPKRTEGRRLKTQPENGVIIVEAPTETVKSKSPAGIEYKPATSKERATEKLKAKLLAKKRLQQWENQINKEADSIQDKLVKEINLNNELELKDYVLNKLSQKYPDLTDEQLEAIWFPLSRLGKTAANNSVIEQQIDGIIDSMVTWANDRDAKFINNLNEFENNFNGDEIGKDVLNMLSSPDALERFDAGWKLIEIEINRLFSSVGGTKEEAKAFNIFFKNAFYDITLTNQQAGSPIDIFKMIKPIVISTERAVFNGQTIQGIETIWSNIKPLSKEKLKDIELKSRLAQLVNEIDYGYDNFGAEARIDKINNILFGGQKIITDKDSYNSFNNSLNSLANIEQAIMEHMCDSTSGVNLEEKGLGLKDYKNIALMRRLGFSEEEILNDYNIVFSNPITRFKNSASYICPKIQKKELSRLNELQQEIHSQKSSYDAFFGITQKGEGVVFTKQSPDNQMQLFHEMGHYVLNLIRAGAKMNQDIELAIDKQVENVFEERLAGDMGVIAITLGKTAKEYFDGTHWSYMGLYNAGIRNTSHFVNLYNKIVEQFGNATPTEQQIQETMLHSLAKFIEYASTDNKELDDLFKEINIRRNTKIKTVRNSMLNKKEGGISEHRDFFMKAGKLFFENNTTSDLMQRATNIDLAINNNDFAQLKGIVNDILNNYDIPQDFAYALMFNDSKVNTISNKVETAAVGLRDELLSLAYDGFMNKYYDISINEDGLLQYDEKLFGSELSDNDVNDITRRMFYYAKDNESGVIPETAKHYAETGFQFSEAAEKLKDLNKEDVKKALNEAFKASKEGVESSYKDLFYSVIDAALDVSPEAHATTMESLFKYHKRLITAMEHTSNFAKAIQDAKIDADEYNNKFKKELALGKKNARKRARVWLEYALSANEDKGASGLKAYDSIIKLLDEVPALMKDVGVHKSLNVAEYFPTIVKDREGMSKLLYGAEPETYLEQQLRVLEEDLLGSYTSMGVEITPAIRENIKNQAIDLITGNLHKATHEANITAFHKRTGILNDKTADILLPYYGSPVEALNDYFESAYRTIMVRELLGKVTIDNKKNPTKGLPNDEMAKEMMDEIAKGGSKLKSGKLGNVLYNIMNSGYDGVSREAVLRFLRTLRSWTLRDDKAYNSMLDKLANTISRLENFKLFNFSSAINQFMDIVVCCGKFGLGDTLKARSEMKREKKYGEKQDTINIEDIYVQPGEEYNRIAGEDWIAKAQRFTAKWSGFLSADIFNKNLLSNTIYQHAKRILQMGSPKSTEFKDLMDSLKNMFTNKERRQKVIDDIISGNSTDDVNLFVFSQMSHSQPVNSASLPGIYNELGPVGRLMFKFMSYGITQMKLIVDHIGTGFKHDKKEGLKRLLSFAFFAIAIGVPVDILKNIIRGRKTDLADSAIMAPFQLMLIDSYFMTTFKQRGAGSALASLFEPNLSLLDDATHNFGSMSLLKSTPLASPVYYWAGGGREQSVRNGEALFHNDMSLLKGEII